MKNRPATLSIVASLENAVKIYGKDDTEIRALDDVSIEVKKGDFIAIMGPSGSGKSTLLQCLAGLDSLSSGKAKIAGKRLDDIKDKELTLLRRENVGFIFQAFNLVPSLNAKDNILLPLTIANKNIDDDWFKTVVKSLRLKQRLSHIPTELSGGQQQRVAAARALVSKPAIIFADEPSGNLDSKSGRELLGFLRKAVDDFKQSIIMVTHDPNAASYADKVVFLDDGKIIDEMKQPTTAKILDLLKSIGK